MITCEEREVMIGEIKISEIPIFNMNHAKSCAKIEFMFLLPKLPLYTNEITLPDIFFSRI